MSSTEPTINAAVGTGHSGDRTQPCGVPVMVAAASTQATAPLPAANVSFLVFKGCNSESLLNRCWFRELPTFKRLEETEFYLKQNT